jgi:hypothetical protein
MRFSLRHLTIERTAFIILFVLLFAMATRVATDTDMWWHLRTGQYISETGQAVTSDVFSYTFDGAPYKNHSTVAQVAMYWIWSLAGNFGMALLTSVLAVGGMFFVYLAGKGTIYMQSFVLIFGAATAASFWAPRPQMFSFFFSTIFIYLLFDYKRNGRDRLIWLIPLMWLWGNSHGGFAIGFIFLGAFIVGEFINNLFNIGDSRLSMKGVRKLVLVTLGALLVLILNPHGIGLLSVPFETFGISELRRYIQEWQSPDFNQQFTWGFVILLSIVIGAVWASRRKFDWTDWFLVCGTTFMALMAGRNLSVFAVAVVPIATYHLDDVLTHNGWLTRHKEIEIPRRARLNVLLVVLVTIGALANILVVADSEVVYEGQSRNLPVDAVAYLNDSELNGNMFNSYNWGGYLMFNAPPHKVYIDGRTDLYVDFLNDYFTVAIGSEEWRDEFEQWDIQFAVIETGSGLAEELSLADDWRTDYQDDLASIFVREG